MFSVIIPLYNKENSISETIESVLNQTYPAFEVIIVDDGSTDESKNKVLSYSDPRIKLIQKPNGGVSDARNKGIEQAKYEYLAFLDADDIWEPEYLSEQFYLIKDFPEGALWSCAYGYLEENVKAKVDHALPEGYKDYISDYFTMKRITDLFCSSSVVVHNKAFAKSGLFDTRIKFSEDLDMWYRIIVNFPVVFYNKTLVYYRQDGENRAMKKKHSLIDFLPFYIGKYNTNPDIQDISFLKYINNWSAIMLMHYYFETQEERNNARLASSKLNYKLIKKKYFMMYKTPFPIGYISYKALQLKKKFW